MMVVLSKYLVAILGTMVGILLVTTTLMGWYISGLHGKLEKQAVELGVVAAMSQEQKVKIVESKVVEEKIKVVLQEKVKIVKEYVYDENKTKCDNAISSMRLTF